MSRPEHPKIPIPASVISRLREEQCAYDRDPGAYEERVNRERQEYLEREYFERECPEYRPGSSCSSSDLPF